MARHHLSKKSSKKQNGKKSKNFDPASNGHKKLPSNFVYSQNHKNIWNNFTNFLDEKFIDEEVGEILDEAEVLRIKTPPAIPAMLEYEPANPADVETEDEKAARKRAQSLLDKSYAAREASHLEGMRKLSQKYGRAIVIVLKHVSAAINLDLHSFLRQDHIKRLDSEQRYKVDEGIPRRALGTTLCFRCR
jgi:hypothetical protein